MKKVLFIAYIYPPIANSGTQRSVKFANNIIDLGWQPIVMTAKDAPGLPVDMELMSEVDERIQVHRVPLQSAKLANGISGIFGNSKLAKWIYEGLEWRLRRNSNTPDPFASWVSTAVDEGIILHEKHRFDVIYASGTPWTSFIVAQKISRAIGVPYILDYRDLWNNIDEGWVEQSDNQTGFKTECENLEKEVVKDAGAIISVTDSCLESLKLNLELDCKKTIIKTITNGYEPDEFNVQPCFSVSNQETFNVGYTGVWKKGYSPEELYRALNQITLEDPNTNIRLHCAGFEIGRAKEYNLPDHIVKEYGRVTHKTALNIMQSCDLLFLPVAQGQYSNISLPGKLFEYLGSGTPILAQVPTDSEVFKVIQKTGSGKCVRPDDTTSLKEQLLLATKDDSRIDVLRNNSALEQYQRKYQAKQLVNILDEVCNRGKPNV